MKRLLATGIILSSVLLLMPTTSHACHGCDKDAKKVCKISKIKNSAKMLWKNQDYLGITDDQMAKIKDAKYDAIKEIIKLKADIDIISVDLQRAMWSSSIDESAVNRLIDKKYEAKSKIAKTYVSTISKFQKTLNEEQREKAFELANKEKMGKDCKKCDSKKHCPDCTKDKKCAKCAMKSEGKFCPITGKPLN